MASGETANRDSRPRSPRAASRRAALRDSTSTVARDKGVLTRRRPGARDGREAGVPGRVRETIARDDLRAPRPASARRSLIREAGVSSMSTFIARNAAAVATTLGAGFEGGHKPRCALHTEASQVQRRLLWLGTEAAGLGQRRAPPQLHWRAQLRGRRRGVTRRERFSPGRDLALERVRARGAATACQYNSEEAREHLRVLTSKYHLAVQPANTRRSARRDTRSVHRPNSENGRRRRWRSSSSSRDARRARAASELGGTDAVRRYGRAPTCTAVPSDSNNPSTEKYRSPVS